MRTNVSALRDLSSYQDQPLIAITGGGTGGHVYPGVAVAAALGALPVSDSSATRDDPASASPRGIHVGFGLAAGSQGNGGPVRLLFIGNRRGMERELAEREGLSFVSVASGPLRAIGPLGKMAGAASLAIGIGQALRIIRRRRVAAVLATGGYVSAPVVLAAWLAGLPTIIYLPDVEPGLAVKFLSRFARSVAVTCEQSAKFLSGRKVIVTGYPLRPELLRAERSSSRQSLSLNREDKVVLVLGGSRGAHSINAALARSLPQLLTQAVVLHSSGPNDEPWLREVAAQLPADLRRRYRLSAYLHEELASAMAAADLAVSRAGASVMGEYPLFGLPSILVPYPFAGAHQHHNAAYLVDNEASVELADADLRGDKLLDVITRLLADEDRLAAMGRSARTLARPNAAISIAEELLKLCSRR